MYKSNNWVGELATKNHEGGQIVFKFSEPCPKSNICTSSQYCLCGNQVAPYTNTPYIPLAVIMETFEKSYYVCDHFLDKYDTLDKSNNSDSSTTIDEIETNNRTPIRTMVCRNCGKTVVQMEATYGGSPFRGWIQITRTYGSTMFPYPDNGPWDFCSNNCAIEFLKLDQNGKNI